MTERGGALEAVIRVAERDVDVSLEIGDGEIVAVVGPNGAGKSTIFAVLAGLLKPSAGHATLGGRTIFDAESGVWLPPHRRRIALLAQEPLLFTHLDALGNVAFPPRVSGASRSDAKAIARHWLAEAEASDLERSKPRQLSGGQAQRVAIARALAADPELLLLDEPMAALDVESVPIIRRMLRRVLAGRRALMITHDALDAIALADRVIVVEKGRVAQHGPTLEVLARPRSAFAARLGGLNLIRGSLDQAELRSASGIRIPRGAGPVAQTATGFAAFPPSALSLVETGSGALRGVVATAESWQDRVLLTVDLAGSTTEQVIAEVPIAEAARVDLSAGQAVELALNLDRVSVYP
jgi:molybdate transport system ATP-binding protein